MSGLTCFPNLLNYQKTYGKKEKFERWVKEGEIIKEHIKKIKHRVVVFSGKGGVGKTTVSVNLSYGLVMRGFATGILDADITVPNVPKMIGVSKKRQRLMRTK